MFKAAFEFFLLANSAEKLPKAIDFSANRTENMDFSANLVKGMHSFGTILTTEESLHCLHQIFLSIL